MGQQGLYSSPGPLEHGNLVTKTGMASDTCWAETVREVLTSRALERIRVEKEEGDYRRASVLIPLMEGEGGCQVLFTRRTHKVIHHKGQISFPGGGIERWDATPLDAALREAWEEIGLRPENVEILGRMDDTVTVASRHLIFPFVGRVLSQEEFRINRDEVEEVVAVPLSFFFQTGATGCTMAIQYEGGTYHTPAYEYEGQVIWGATGRIMRNLVELLSEQMPLHWEKR